MGKELGGLISLPLGYSVRKERGVGVSFLDEEGRFVEQHPKDCNAIRILVWEHYKKSRKILWNR